MLVVEAGDVVRARVGGTIGTYVINKGVAIGNDGLEPVLSLVLGSVVLR